LFIIAKGKGKRVESAQLGDMKEHQCDNSVRGWATVETMMRHLMCFRERYLPVTTRSGKKALPVDLVLD
jgi:hypothetical protein